MDLAAIDRGMVREFVSLLMEIKAFDNASDLKDKIVEKHLSADLGNSPELMDFAKLLVSYKEADALRELREAGRLFGDKKDPDLIIIKLTNKYDLGGGKNANR